jgi:hypothetical protein
VRTEAQPASLAARPIRRSARSKELEVVIPDQEAHRNIGVDRFHLDAARTRFLTPASICSRVTAF